jgi:hypothetical protein
MESDEDAMNIKGYAAGLCVAAIAATAMAVPAAEAQTRKKQYVYTTTTRAAPARSPRARVTVAPRSFLDAGTEVRPGDRKFTDYAFPASGNGGIGINAVTNTGGKVGWDRSPMMQPFQLPGYNPW